MENIELESGIYLIRCKITKKVYVGQSRHIKGRFRFHMYDLKRGKHGNAYLKHAYDKYGKDNFEYEIIERCEIEKLDEREKYWMDHYQSYNPQFGFNILTDSKFAKAVKAMWDQPEYKKRISEMHKIRWQDPEFAKKNLAGIHEHHQKQIEKFGCLAFNTPEAQRKNIEKTKLLSQNPEWIKQKSDFAYKQLEDPIYREANLKRLAEGRNNPLRAENLAKHNEWQATDEEHKSKMAELQKSYWSDEEHRKMRTERIKEAMIPEIVKKIADANRGKKKSEEARKKMSESALRRHQNEERSPETEAKRLAGYKKRVEERKAEGFKYKKREQGLSEETKKKQSEAAKKRDPEFYKRCRATRVANEAKRKNEGRNLVGMQHREWKTKEEMLSYFPTEVPKTAETPQNLNQLSFDFGKET